MLNLNNIKKTFVVFLLALATSSCVVHAEDEPLPCGYEEKPYDTPSLYCDVNPWTYKGECCVWIREEFYSECHESWCYNKNICGWIVNQRWCKPI
jgi:hypothetical protein